MLPHPTDEQVQSEELAEFLGRPSEAMSHHSGGPPFRRVNTSKPVKIVAQPTCSSPPLTRRCPEFDQPPRHTSICHVKTALGDNLTTS